MRPSTKKPAIFDFGNNTTTYMFLTPQNGANGRLRFGITTNSNGGEQQINSGVSVPTGAWHHLAITLSGLVATLYLDGAAVGTTNNMTLNPSGLGSTIRHYIGKSQWDAPYLDGKIDNFRLYSVALSAGEVATIITPFPAPGNPAAIAADGQIALQWNASANATRYHVLRSLFDGGPYTQVALVTSTNFNDVGLTNGTAYYYVVQAANAVGESPWSKPVSARPVSTTPPELAMLVSGNQLELSWPADHTGWRLEARTNAPGEGLAGTGFRCPVRKQRTSSPSPCNPQTAASFIGWCIRKVRLAQSASITTMKSQLR